jgi:hypothetical protein
VIKDVKLAKEIIVSENNKVGILANISKMLADSGINIQGIAGYTIDKEAKIMLVTEDNLRSVDAIKKAGYKAVKESEVVMAELINKPGALKSLTAKLAAGGIDLKYAYGTVCSAGCPGRIVLSTSDNEKAVALLKG